jgi:tellurite resistance protein TerC
MRWSGAAIALGLGFTLVALALRGPPAALTYLTAYLLEQSLSVDNVFVFVVIFQTLAIPEAHQRRVLYWGVLGALVTRGVMIAAGVTLFEHFHWVTYPFGVLILLAAARLIWGQERERDLVVNSCAVCSTWVARVIPVTPVLQGGRFWVRSGGRLVATPLLIALVVVETTDVVFALDSVPAVLSVTRDPFLIYTSNVLAVLGMRSLYFLVENAAARFDRLRFGLAAILAFAGAKLLLSRVVDVPTSISLAVIAAALGLSLVASRRAPVRSSPGA